MSKNIIKTITIACLGVLVFLLGWLIIKKPNEGNKINLSSINKLSISKPEKQLSQKIYLPQHKFEDYPALEKFTGPIPKLDFSTCAYGKQFLTITKEWVAQGLNFAGHYVFAYWRYGSNYYMSSVVDLKTGKVYAGPEASNLYDFKPNSKLIVANPPDSTGRYDDSPYISEPVAYLWSGKRF